VNGYYDTGVLVPLYVAETFSTTVNALAIARNEAIPIHAFHQLEFVNAVRLKQFRNEIAPATVKQIMLDVDADLHAGRLILRPVNWIAAIESAREISVRSTAETGCRTLDLIHVVIAVQWGCKLFVSTDQRQLAAARQAGLETIDIAARHAGG